MRDLGHCFDIEGQEIGITERFRIDRLGLVGDLRFDRFGIGIRERHLDPHSGQRVVEQVVGTAIEAGGGNDLIPGASQCLNGRDFGGLTGRKGKTHRAAFERGDPLFEDIGRRIHDPRIDIPEFLQCEQIGGMFGTVELERRGHKDRDREGFRGRIGNPPHMQRLCFESGLCFAHS